MGLEIGSILQRSTNRWFFPDFTAALWLRCVDEGPCVISRAWWGDWGHFRPAVIRHREPIVAAAVMDLFVLADHDLKLPRERAFWFIWGPAAFITACFIGSVCERDGASGSVRECVGLSFSSVLFVTAVSLVHSLQFCAIGTQKYEYEEQKQKCVKVAHPGLSLLHFYYLLFSTVFQLFNFHKGWGAKGVVGGWGSTTA